MINAWDAFNAWELRWLNFFFFPDTSVEHDGVQRLKPGPKKCKCFVLIVRWYTLKAFF